MHSCHVPRAVFSIKCLLLGKVFLKCHYLEIYISSITFQHCIPRARCSAASRSNAARKLSAAQTVSSTARSERCKYQRPPASSLLAPCTILYKNNRAPAVPVCARHEFIKCTHAEFFDLILKWACNGMAISRCISIKCDSPPRARHKTMQ